ncbi:Ribosomal protein S11 [Spironucleus salmonicida]|uniref:Small ribosomal subunit protein uS17 n=1 Tax=Spironucleus salmonicida TaxID=348837 RepID=V6LN95_9EUKA|nr:Ribosomal protein S11 [Spironucleus salmonicida]|eukprot:EST42189.1 Ribosomal protein S11 [Spironucleus salmonicida]
MEGQLIENFYHQQPQVCHTKLGENGKAFRFYKSIGKNFETPQEAITGHYIDKKCPFTSDIEITGRIIKGVVSSHKMQRTLIIRRDYLHYVTKYKRFEKRHKKIAAHISPCFRVKEGDIVTIGECRQLSKTVSFNVIKTEEVAEHKRKRFMPF